MRSGSHGSRQPGSDIKYFYDKLSSLIELEDNHGQGMADEGENSRQYFISMAEITSPEMRSSDHRFSPTQSRN